MTIGPGAADRVEPMLGHPELSATQKLEGLYQGMAHVKRLARPPAEGLDRYDREAAGAQSPYVIGLFVETKTVWHPIGA